MSFPFLLYLPQPYTTGLSRLRKLFYIILFLFLPVCLFAQQDTTRSLFSDTLQMNEFVISAKTAVHVHGDTISYRVDSFITDPLANTEDVLKRLPGVEVSRDGKITIQGKPVNKLFINGKEYFADDLRSVIQNLPAEILEKIQVADYRDEDAVLTGNKENTTEKVINLQMKKKYNGGIYGRVGAGYGSKDRYQGGLFANYMNDFLRLTAIGNAKNTGMSDVSSDDGGSAGNTSWSSPGVRTDQNANFNFSYDKGKQFQLNGSYRYANSKNYLQRSSYRTSYLPTGQTNDSLLLQESNSEQRSNSKRHSLSLRSKYKFKEKTSLRTVVSLRTGTQITPRTAEDITYNSDATTVNFSRISETDNNRQTSSLGLNNTFARGFNKKGRSLLLRWNLGYGYNELDGIIDNKNNYFFPVSATKVLNETEETGNNFNSGANVNYTEPIGEYNSIALSYTNNYVISKNDRTVTVANNGTYIKDTNQSLGYENINTTNKIRLTYQYSNDKLTGGLGFVAEPYSRKSIQTSGAANDVTQTGVNYFPKLFTRYSLSKTSDVSLTYNGGINPPNINQLQPIPDYTDSLNIFIGNPQLRPELDNNVLLRWSSNNLKKGRNIWAYVQANWVSGKIINNTELTDSKRTVTPVNADGNYNLNSYVSITEPFIKKKLKGILYLRAAVGNNVTIVNGTLQKIANYTFVPAFRMTYYTDKWYEGSLDYSYRWNKVDGATRSNNLMESHDLTHEGTFIFPMGIRASYYLSYMVNKGLAQDFQQEFFLVNAMFSKSFKKSKGLSIRVYAFDVFNNYPTVNRYVSNNYYEDVSVNRLGSYLMLSVVYKFTSFPEKGKRDKEEDSEE